MKMIVNKNEVRKLNVFLHLNYKQEGLVICSNCSKLLNFRHTRK